MRRDSPRDAWADVCRFLERAAKPWRGEGKSLTIIARRWAVGTSGGAGGDWLPEWPTDCSVADFQAAVRFARQCFGSPAQTSGKAFLKRCGLEEEYVWRVPTARVGEVLDFLERVPTCTRGTNAPVHASCQFVFRLRDLETGAVLPHQGERHHPFMSMMNVTLQEHCSATLWPLVLPFARPDEATANYVVALQSYLPVWLDPRYFDHVTLAPDGSGYRRLRLRPEWIGRTPSGALRLDASLGGIIPKTVDLPTEAELAAEDPARDDAPFQANFAAVATALRGLELGTLVIRGADDAAYMVEHAAKWIGLPLHVVRTRPSAGAPGLADELRTTIAQLEERPAVLLLEIGLIIAAEASDALLSQLRQRVPMGVEIPPDVRLVVSMEGSPGEAAQAAEARWDDAQLEGFGSPEQLDFLRREAARARWRDVVVEVLPPPARSG